MGGMDENAMHMAGKLDPDPEAGTVPVILPGFKLTDLGNAERLVACFRDRIRYCPPRKRWLTWDGKRWAWDETGEIVRLAKQTVRAIYAEAARAGEDEAKAIAKHAAKSEDGNRIAQMIKLASTEAGIAVMPADLDANPWLFNCGNGTIDLKSGELRRHDRRDLITKITPIEYRPEATSCLWDEYLKVATGCDTELAAYLQRAVGYAMQGTTAEKMFWFIYGPPNGTKSTFIGTIECAFGEYATAASFETWLVQSSTGGNRGDLVRLLGARLVSSVEVRKGAKFDESILKAITGGDAITAAAKYESDITFFATFALWLAGNDCPIIRDDDEGAWSRVRRIPFTNPLPKEKQDPKMRENLRGAVVQMAVLNWAVKGCLEWQKRGIGTCAAVERSSAEYRAEMDRVASFFAERCVFGTYEKVARGVLREAYEDWCKETGVRFPLNGNEFAARLKERNVEPGKTHGVRQWKGVRLLKDDEEPVEGDRGSAGDSVPRNFPMSTHQEKSRGEGAPGVPLTPTLFDEEREAIQREVGE
jgi:putative DNA primase/helicase